MATWAVQQQFPRSSVRIPIVHTVLSSPLGRTGMGWTCNMSEGGACVEVGEAVSLNATLHLRFQTDRGDLEAEAVVVWAGASGGEKGLVAHGVAFTRMATEQREALRELLRTQGKLRHTGARFAADLPVTFQIMGQPEPPRWGWVENVSRGGLLLSLPELLRPGTRLRVSWKVASEQLTVEGMIIWVEPRDARAPGGSFRHGFRFTALGCSPSSVSPSSDEWLG